MARQRVSVLRMKYLTYGRVRVKGYNASMILNAETLEQISAVGAGLEHPLGQDTLTFFQGSALNFGNYLDEVWTMDKRSGGVTVADLNDGTGSDRHFYHCNALYHVYALTDEAGAIAEAVQSYDAYGKISALITGSGSDSTWFTSDDVLATNPNVSAIGNTFFYTGQRVDPETGLYYYKNRYYSAELGRFVSRDPVGYEAGINLYEYAASDPIGSVDELGLKSKWNFKAHWGKVKGPAKATKDCPCGTVDVEVWADASDVENAPGGQDLIAEVTGVYISVSFKDNGTCCKGCATGDTIGWAQWRKTYRSALTYRWHDWDWTLESKPGCEPWYGRPDHKGASKSLRDYPNYSNAMFAWNRHVSYFKTQAFCCGDTELKSPKASVLWIVRQLGHVGPTKKRKVQTKGEIYCGDENYETKNPFALEYFGEEQSHMPP